MAANASLLITINDGSGRTATDLSPLTGPGAHNEVNRLIDYLAGMGSGTGAGNLSVSVASAALLAATGTVTCASVQNNDTITINGVVFTAKTAVAGANEFNIGASDTTCAAAIVTSINASTTALIQGFISPSSASGVVTLTAIPAGVVGNAYTLASSNGGRLAVSGARLSGGTGGLGTSTSVYNLAFPAI